ncbi:unnamed protein product [Boreogadus saida]
MALAGVNACELSPHKTVMAARSREGGHSHGYFASAVFEGQGVVTGGSQGPERRAVARLTLISPDSPLTWRRIALHCGQRPQTDLCVGDTARWMDHSGMKALALVARVCPSQGVAGVSRGLCLLRKFPGPASCRLRM